MTSLIYHRLTAHDPGEIDKVVASGEVWGTVPRASRGGSAPCVKAYLGPLPQGRMGYEFTTDVAPTLPSVRHYGRFIASWEEGSPGVLAVDGPGDYVRIKVTLHAISR